MTVVVAPGRLDVASIRNPGQPPGVRLTITARTLVEPTTADMVPSVAREIAAQILTAADEADRMTAALETPK